MKRVSLKEKHSDFKKNGSVPKFVYADVVGMESLLIQKDKIEIGDKIGFIPEPSNPKDPNAIKVLHSDANLLGYVLAVQARYLLDFVNSGTKTCSGRIISLYPIKVCLIVK